MQWGEHDDADIATWGDPDDDDPGEPSQLRSTIAFLSHIEGQLTRALEADCTPPATASIPERVGYLQVYLERARYELQDVLNRIGVHRMGLQVEPCLEVVDW